MNWEKNWGNQIVCINIFVHSFLDNSTDPVAKRKILWSHFTKTWLRWIKNNVEKVNISTNAQSEKTIKTVPMVCNNCMFVADDNKTFCLEWSQLSPLHVGSDLWALRRKSSYKYVLWKNLFKRHNENQYEKMLIPTIHDCRQYVQFHQTLLPSFVKIKVKQIKNK